MTDEHVDGTAAEIAALKIRVLGVESSFNRLDSAITSLTMRLDTNQRTPWAIIWSAAGVLLAILVTISTIAYQPVESNMRRNEKALERLQQEAVLEADLERRFHERDDARRIWQDNREREIAENKATIDQVRDRIVPRGEHEEKWNSQRTRDVDLQRQIDDLRNRLGDVYSPKDALATLQRRIDSLETTLYMNARTNP